MFFTNASSSSLFRQIPTNGIATTKKEVGLMMEVKKNGRPYEHFSSQEKAQISKYVAEHGVAAALRHVMKILFLKVLVHKIKIFSRNIGLLDNF